MKRDMALVREVLLRVEALPVHSGRRAGVEASDPEFQIDGYTHDQVDHHLLMLIQAGLIDGKALNRQYAISGLTWQGCEFLDTVRSPEVWTRAQRVAAKVGTVSLAVFGEIAKAEMKKMLGLP